MKKENPRAGQESVWDYPRPPRLEPSSQNVRVLFAGQLIAESSSAYRVLETSHPPSWYIPRSDVFMEFLKAAPKQSFCEWKGLAHYWSVRVGAQVAEDAAWSYETPTRPFTAIRQYLAFYPSVFECYVNADRVVPQPGGFYGGWITPDIAGPFKGIAGSAGW